MKKTAVLLFFIISTLFLHAQDSCSIRISLLTCTPGTELYSTFGHSAMRVTNPATGRDSIFNYGTFDFYDPGFYEKFIKGKLLYFVSVSSPPAFLEEYEYFGRGVTEQVLNIDCNTAHNLEAALYENAKEENKYYRYDFTYDNCTTRLRDILEKAMNKPLQTANILPSDQTTFRHLIHEYLNRGQQHWSKLGIDILLGIPLDRAITNREAMFLPDYLMMAFDNARMDHSPLVREKKLLLPAAIPVGPKPFFTPFVVMGILFLLVLLLSIKANRSTFARAFDVFFFFVCGMLGCLILFMWLGTNHHMCRNNLNLLWAFPPHAIIAFFLFTKKAWVKTYFRIIFFFGLGLLATWVFLPQQMNPALLPVLGIIIVRSFFISKSNENG